MLTYIDLCTYFKSKLDDETFKVIPRMFPDEFPIFNIEYKNRLYRLTSSTAMQVGKDLNTPAQVLDKCCVYPDFIYFSQIDSTYRKIRDNPSTERIYHDRWIEYLRIFRDITGINPDKYP